jgi:hypothetical protein
MNSIGRVAALLLGIFSTPALAETIHGTLYKDQHCECCEAHAEYLRNNGFDLKIEAVKNHADRIFDRAGPRRGRRSTEFRRVALKPRVATGNGE